MKNEILKKIFRFTLAISNMGLISCSLFLLLTLLLAGFWKNSGLEWMRLAGPICYAAALFCSVAGLIGQSANQCVRCVAQAKGCGSDFFRTYECPSLLRPTAKRIAGVKCSAGVCTHSHARSHRRASRSSFANVSSSSGDNSGDGSSDSGDLPASSTFATSSTSLKHPKKQHYLKRPWLMLYSRYCCYVAVRKGVAI